MPDSLDTGLLGQHRHDRARQRDPPALRAGLRRPGRVPGARDPHDPGRQQRRRTSGRSAASTSRSTRRRCSARRLTNRAASRRPARPRTAAGNRLRQHRQGLGPRRRLAPRSGRRRLRGAAAGRRRSSPTPRSRLRPARPGPDQLLRHQPAGRGARATPGYVNADNAGFAFSFSLPNASAIPPGVIGDLHADRQHDLDGGRQQAGRLHERRRTHTLAIRAGDIEEDETQFGAMSVDILCDQIERRPAGLRLHRHADGATSSSTATFEVFGWAYDFQGVSAVEVDVDGQVVGNAGYGLSRPDVPPNDPRVPSSQRRVLVHARHDASCPIPQHDLVIYVIDSRGNRTEIGRRKCVVDNKPELDRARRGGHPRETIAPPQGGAFFSVAPPLARSRCCATAAGSRIANLLPPFGRETIRDASGLVASEAGRAISGARTSPRGVSSVAIKAGRPASVTGRSRPRRGQEAAQVWGVGVFGAESGQGGAGGGGGGAEG